MFDHLFNHSTFNLFNQFFNNTPIKNIIIDPISCVIRLAILSFKPKGTKISIIDNRIAYNEPNFLQGPIRWTYGDNREDLHNIYMPIVKVLEWYDFTKPEIKNILDLCLLGLEKLKQSYIYNSSICHSIDHYKQIIIDTYLDKNNTNDDNTQASHQDVNKVYSDLKKLWNSNEISIVHTILNEMKSTEDDKLNALINALEAILQNKEKEVKRIIIENTTLFN